MIPGLTEFGAYSYFDEIVGVNNHRAEGKDVSGQNLPLHKWPLQLW